MRETRPSGSEGGGAGQPALPTPIEARGIQARGRGHPGLPSGPGQPARVEFAYEGGGAPQYLAAWDVRRGRVMDPLVRAIGDFLATPGRLA